MLEETVKDILSSARRANIPLDGLSKQRLSAAFLGISANFFHPESCSSIFVLLNLFQIKHTHAGQNIADCVEERLKSWDISKQKIDLVVNDNGPNMFKVIKLINSKVEDSSNDSGDNHGDTALDSDDDPDELDHADDVNECHLAHFSCLEHSLQLVAKLVSTDDFEEFQLMILKNS